MNQVMRQLELRFCTAVFVGYIRELHWTLRLSAFPEAMVANLLDLFI